jgi:hypothetical protein
VNCPQCSEPAHEGATVCAACGAVLREQAAPSSVREPSTQALNTIQEPLFGGTAVPAPGTHAGSQAGLAVAPAREESPVSFSAPAREGSPTTAALAEVTQINQQISRAPLPGAYLHTLKRVGIGVGAFLVAAILGIYVAKAGDWMEETLQKAEAERAQRDAQEQFIEQQYERIARGVPSDQLKQLLKEAGSKKELIARIQRDPRTGKYYLRNK